MPATRVHPLPVTPWTASFLSTSLGFSRATCLELGLILGGPFHLHQILPKQSYVCNETNKWLGEGQWLG